ncbi:MULTISPECIES: hypothetical protein [unclassified Novosphingobium]|uniref:hypothetical protein n=1 Tax=unclassified Novosphingobium TaxID=2644732 RepID=UPI001359843D|nr:MULTISPECIES: hypothetical protein [unclassified Novosphingobium]
MTVLFLVFGSAIYIDRAATGWLVAMSFAVIVITAQAFGAAKQEPRYWSALMLYCLLHLGVLSFSNEAWIPKPTSAITPLFLLDYLAMGWAFSRISGLQFDMS